MKVCVEVPTLDAGTLLVESAPEGRVRIDCSGDDVVDPRLLVEAVSIAAGRKYAAPVIEDSLLREGGKAMGPEVLIPEWFTDATGQRWRWSPGYMRYSRIGGES